MTSQTATSDRISYAQNFEDVRLWRALRDWPHHTYVDIGAGHPYKMSVTRLFYERGWRGLNIEPGPHFEALKADRPEDRTLQIVVCGHNGVIPFHIAAPHPDLSSVDADVLDANKTLVESRETVERSCRRLADLLAEYQGETPIAFMKIDVEGAEKAVIESNDWTRFAPAVVIVEAIEPVAHAPSHEEWEPVLLSNRYRMVYDDGINRFYLHAHAAELESALARPITPRDRFTPYIWLKHSQARVSELEREMERLSRRVEQLERERRALKTGPEGEQA